MKNWLFIVFSCYSYICFVMRSSFTDTLYLRLGSTNIPPGPPTMKKSWFGFNSNRPYQINAIFYMHIYIN